jgi:hypothetical protein
MSWRPVATKGCLTLDVLTARRTLTELAGDDRKDVTSCHIECEGERFDYLLRFTPDDSEPVMALTKDAASVRSFIREMEPRSVQVLVGAGEDEFAAGAVLRGEVH